MAFLMKFDYQNYIARILQITLFKIPQDFISFTCRSFVDVFVACFLQLTGFLNARIKLHPRYSIQLDTGYDYKITEAECIKMLQW